MMKVTCAILLACIAACAAQRPTNYAYAIRRDTRKCAYPNCGGYYIKDLNRRRTRCADNSRATECYVVQLDLTAVSDGNGIEQFRISQILESVTSYEDGEFIVQGSYSSNEFYKSKDLVDFIVSKVYTHIDPLCDCQGESEICTYDLSVKCEGCDCPTVCVSTEKAYCGGFAGTMCPNDTLSCVDDPSDSCDPKRGGADCIGICTGICDQGDTRCVSEVGGFCGGLLGSYCGEGLECVDNLSVGCSNRCGAADCGGTCVPSQ